MREHMGRESILLNERMRLLHILQWSIRPWNGWDVKALCNLSGCDFVAHFHDNFGGRSDDYAMSADFGGVE